MLNEKQIRSIDLLIAGESSIQAVAKAVGVSRQTIHRWRTDDEEYKEEYGKRLQMVTNTVTQKFGERLDVAVESLYDIMTDPSVATRERKDSAIYWINRVAGTPTSKIESSSTTTDTKVTEDDILSAIDVARATEDDEKDNISYIN